MYGLEAIRAANGWTISFLGILVVFSALTFLSVVMANLNRVLDLIDKAQAFLAKKRLEKLVEKPSDYATPEPKSTSPGVVHLNFKEKELMEYFELITRKLGEPFSLAELLEKAEERGINKPHSGLYLLIKKGLIAECEGECMGFYCWQKDVKVDVDRNGEEN